MFHFFSFKCDDEEAMEMLDPYEEAFESDELFVSVTFAVRHPAEWAI